MTKGYEPDQDSMKLILASTSPRRRELIRLFGAEWEILGADVDETSVDDLDPAVNVLETARLKAETVARMAVTQSIIVAADTTVVLDGQILNKPADHEDARRMLRRLRGRTHFVHTGLVAINKATAQTASDLATIEVPMRDYSEAEIDAYVATGNPLDKAGAYAIQNNDFDPVSKMTGCYSGVMGLPLCHLARTLRLVGVTFPVDIAAACQEYHQYDCPVYARILEPGSRRGGCEEFLAQ